MVSIKLASGRAVDFEIDTARAGSPLFVLGVRKSGSSILNMIVGAMAQANGWPMVDVGGGFFFRNINVPEWQRDPALAGLIYPGNVYAGFRNMPLGLWGSKPFMQAPKVLMVRDPRDALVSEYFSNAYSHPIPEATGEGDAVTRLLQAQRQRALDIGIEQDVLERATQMAGTMMQYGAVSKLPSTKMLKYEEYILDKELLIRTIAAHFGWSINEGVIRAILEWADVRPTEENPKQFVRKVTPGDYREKLSATAISKLNELVRPAMEMFGYSVEPANARAPAPAVKAPTVKTPAAAAAVAAPQEKDAAKPATKAEGEGSQVRAKRKRPGAPRRPAN